MKVFAINDCDWYMADTLEQAIELAIKDTGLPRNEIVDRPHEIDEQGLERLVFHNEDGSRWSFAYELRNRIEAGMSPGMFASTEF